MKALLFLLFLSLFSTSVFAEIKNEYVEEICNEEGLCRAKIYGDFRFIQKEDGWHNIDRNLYAGDCESDYTYCTNKDRTYFRFNVNGTFSPPKAQYNGRNFTFIITKLKAGEFTYNMRDPNNHEGHVKNNNSITYDLTRGIYYRVTDLARGYKDALAFTEPLPVLQNNHLEVFYEVVGNFSQNENDFLKDHYVHIGTMYIEAKTELVGTTPLVIHQLENNKTVMRAVIHKKNFSLGFPVILDPEFTLEEGITSEIRRVRVDANTRAYTRVESGRHIIGNHNAACGAINTLINRAVMEFNLSVINPKNIEILNVSLRATHGGSLNVSKANFSIRVMPLFASEVYADTDDGNNAMYNNLTNAPKIGEGNLTAQAGGDITQRFELNHTPTATNMSGALGNASTLWSLGFINYFEGIGCGFAIRFFNKGASEARVPELTIDYLRYSPLHRSHFLSPEDPGLLNVEDPTKTSARSLLSRFLSVLRGIFT